MKEFEEIPLKLRYGWGKVRPHYLQFMNNTKCFLLFVIVFVLSQGMAVGGLSNVVLSTIEKRFQFSSKEAGFIAASNDISAILLTSFVSFYGGYGNKPKWLGYGALFTGIGCLLFSLPHLLIGRYHPDLNRGMSNNQSLPLCFANTSLGHASSSTCFSGYGGNWYYLMIFSIAQMIMGAGTTPLYSLAPAFIDENVDPKSCPIYLAVFFGSAIVGPGLGFIVGGGTLSKWVDLRMPKGMYLAPKDPRWIGAWWLGYVFSGALLVLSCVILLGFPRELPGARERREQCIKEGNLPSKDEKIKETFKDMIPATWQLLKNPVFVFNALALTASTFFGAALLPFISKILYLKFDLNPAKAGMMIGIAVIPGTIGGALLGGCLVRRFKLKKSLLMAAKYCLIIKVLTSFGGLQFIMPGCNEVQLAGIVQPYRGSQAISNSVVSACNRNCSCPLAQIRPVCGADKLTYFSPCFAGCTLSAEKGVYSNCSCVTPPLNFSGPEAVSGECDRGTGCTNSYIFLAIVVVFIFTSFVIAVPNKTVVLRSVPDNLRAYALGFQFIFQRSLGFLPGPVVMGWVVDMQCLVWGESCSTRGSCQFYDVKSLSYLLTFIAVSVQGISAIFYFLSYWFCKRNTTEETKSIEVEELICKETVL